MFHLVWQIKRLDESISDEPKIRTEINKLLDYQKGIEAGIIKYEEDMEFYEKNSHCDTCEQEIPQEHRDKMIDKFHGKMHELSGGLIQLGHKLDDQQTRSEEINRVIKSTQEFQGTIAKNQNSIQACTQYINKVSNQNDEISETSDDIKKKKRHCQMKNTFMKWRVLCSRIVALRVEL